MANNSVVEGEGEIEAGRDDHRIMQPGRWQSESDGTVFGHFTYAIPIVAIRFFLATFSDVGCIYWG
jgi:hypothetical protein